MLAAATCKLTIYNLMYAEEEQADQFPARAAAPVLPEQGNQPCVSKPQGVAHHFSLTCISYMCLYGWFPQCMPLLLIMILSTLQGDHACACCDN